MPFLMLLAGGLRHFMGLQNGGPPGSAALKERWRTGRGEACPPQADITRL